MTRNWRLHYIQSLTLYNKDSIKFQVTWIVQLITWSLTSCFWQKEWIFDPVLFRLRIYFYQGGITTIAISLQFRILAMLKVKCRQQLATTIFFIIRHSSSALYGVLLSKLTLSVTIEENCIQKVRKYNCNSTINYFFNFGEKFKSELSVRKWYKPILYELLQVAIVHWKFFLSI